MEEQVILVELHVVSDTDVPPPLIFIRDQIRHSSEQYIEWDMHIYILYTQTYIYTYMFTYIDIWKYATFHIFRAEVDFLVLWDVPPSTFTTSWPPRPHRISASPDEVPVGGESGILIGKTLRVYSISAVYRHTWSISGTVCLYYKWYIYICIIRIYSRVLEFCLIPWSIWPYSEHGEPWLGWRHRNGFEWLTPDVDMTNPRQNPQFVMPSLWYLCF